MRYLPFSALLVLMSCSSCATVKSQEVAEEEPVSAPAKVFTKLVEADEEVISPRNTEDGFRHIILVGEINGKSVKPLIDELESGKNFKGFILELNSPGGEVDPGFLLAKAIENAGVPVHCMVDGEGMSMGYYILQSCTTRHMTKRAVLMIHGPSMFGQMGGNSNRFQEMTDGLSALNKAMIEQYVARMKITKKELEAKILTKAWYLNWEEALKVGAIDSVVKNYAEMLKFAQEYKH